MFNAYTIYFYLPLLVAQIKENCVLFRAEKINNFFFGYLKMNKNCKKNQERYSISIYYANLSMYAQAEVDFKDNKLMPKNLFQLVVAVVWMTQLLIETAL